MLAQQKSGNDTALQIGDLTRMQGLRDTSAPGTTRRGTRHPPTGPPTATTGTSSFGV